MIHGKREKERHDSPESEKTCHETGRGDATANNFLLDCTHKKQVTVTLWWNKRQLQLLGLLYIYFCADAICIRPLMCRWGDFRFGCEHKFPLHVRNKEEKWTVIVIRVLEEKTVFHITHDVFSNTETNIFKENIWEKV